MVEDDTPKKRDGLLGVLDLLNSSTWLSFLFISLIVDCGLMTYVQVSEEKLIEANLDDWNNPVQILANLNYIYCGVLFVDSCLRLFTFCMFSCAKKQEDLEHHQNQTFIRTVAEDVGSLVHKTVTYPFTVTPAGKWEHWQMMVYDIANLTTRVMEFMVPAFFDFAVSGIAFFNIVPGLPFRRDMSVLTAYVAKLTLVILNSLVVTSMVKGFLGADEGGFEEKYAHKLASKSDSTDIVVPWTPPLVAVSVALAFFITHHHDIAWMFVVLAILFILRGALRASPCMRVLLATAVTLMVTGVVVFQQIYGCTAYDGDLGFALGSGGDFMNEFRSDCCAWPPPPAVQPSKSTMCDARCSSTHESLIGCDADGINNDCRFCGSAETIACAAMGLGSWRAFFDPSGMSHNAICSHFRILGMLLIGVQALMLVLEAIFFGEVALVLREDEDMSPPKRWMLSFIADVLYQPYAGYEVLCYDLGIFAVALLHQMNIRVPIQSIRIARFVVYKTRNTIPWLNYQYNPDAMRSLIRILKAKSATYYEERSDWYVRAERIEIAKYTSADEGMETQIEEVPFS